MAIVSETFAKRYWPGLPDPLGRRVRMGGEKAPWITVVGVSRDVRHLSLTDPPRPELYRPHAQAPARIMMIVARGRGGAESAAPALRSAVWQVDREQPLYRMQSAEEGLALRNAGGRATTQVLGFLAIVALVLAAVGTYGVMAYAAAQRVREIGIRLALGASAAAVFWMMLRGGILLASHRSGDRTPVGLCPGAAPALHRRRPGGRQSPRWSRLRRRRPAAARGCFGRLCGSGLDRHASRPGQRPPPGVGSARLRVRDYYLRRTCARFG